MLTKPVEIFHNAANMTSAVRQDSSEQCLTGTMCAFITSWGFVVLCHRHDFLLTIPWNFSKAVIFSKLGGKKKALKQCSCAIQLLIDVRLCYYHLPFYQVMYQISTYLNLHSNGSQLVFSFFSDLYSSISSSPIYLRFFLSLYNTHSQRCKINYLKSRKQLPVQVLNTLFRQFELS